MGYYTSYKLEVEAEDAIEIIDELRFDNEVASYALDEDGDTMESCKWYEHKKDLQKFSKRHPDILFKLSGEGEESDDIWVEYYKNGKVTRYTAEIKFPDFNEKDLE